MISQRKRAANWISDEATSLQLRIEPKSIGGQAKLARVKDSSQPFMLLHTAVNHKNKMQSSHNRKHKKKLNHPTSNQQTTTIIHFLREEEN